LSEGAGLGSRYDAIRHGRARSRRRYRHRRQGIHPEGFRDKPLDARAPIARDWRDIMVIVVGGAGKHSAVIPTFGMTRSVTRLIAG
jgi:hypothetical protein